MKSSQTGQVVEYKRKSRDPERILVEVALTPQAEYQKRSTPRGLRISAQGFRTLGMCSMIKKVNPEGVVEGEDQGATAHR